MQRKLVTVEASKLRWLMHMKGWEKTSSSLKRTRRIEAEFEKKIEEATGYKRTKPYKFTQKKKRSVLRR